MNQSDIEDALEQGICSRCQRDCVGSGDLGALSAGEDLADELTTLIKQLGAVWDEAIRLKEERLTKDQDNIALYWCGKRDGLRTAMMALSDYRAAIRTRLAIAQTEQNQAIRDVFAERRRQVEAERWTPSHDDDHADGAMALAAAAYAYASCQSYRCTRSDAPSWWPWDHEFWKPSLPRRDLVKAGALILAEIERLDRAAKNAGDNQ